MNRRTLFKAVVGGAALAVLPTQHTLARDAAYSRADSIWYDKKDDPQFALVSMVTFYVTNEDAKDAFEDFLSRPQQTVEDGGYHKFQRIMLPSELDVLRMDDVDAIAFRIDAEFGEGFYLAVRHENLLYQFTSTAVLGYDFATIGTHVIEAVIERAEPGINMSGEELLELLPTKQEAKLGNFTYKGSESYRTY